MTRLSRIVLLALLLALPAHAIELLGVASSAARPDPNGAAGPRTEAMERATAALDAFLKVYWDPARKMFFTHDDRSRDPDHPWGPDRGLYSDFWWNAHLFELMLDAYEATRDPRFRQLAWEVRQGFHANYDVDGNAFNDDLGWWAQAFARAYEMTGERRYLDDAIKLHFEVARFWDDAHGGGIWWKRDGSDPQKGVPIEAPFVITSLRLYRATGDPRYRSWAERSHAWLVRTLFKDGGVLLNSVGNAAWNDAEFSYNYGTFIGASLAMHALTGEARFLEQAIAAGERSIVALAPGGIVRDEGKGDGCGFKMIYTRYLAELAAHDARARSFLEHNARTAWMHRRTGDQLIGYDWARPTPGSRIESFSAASGVAVQLHALLAQRVRPAAGAPAPSARAVTSLVEAETGQTPARPIGIEALHGSFTGSGYVAGWNEPGQTLVLTVSVRGAGRYAIGLRYAAAPDDARRTITIGRHVHQVRFPRTQSWDAWSRIVIPAVDLPAGPSTLRIQMDRRGDGGWLNLDHVVVEDTPVP